MISKLKKIILVFTFASVFVFCVSSIMFSPQYMFRIIAYRESDVEDYKIFNERPIKKDDNTYFYTRVQNTNLGNQIISYKYKDTLKEKALDELLEDTGTTAFIIIKDDNVMLKNYSNANKTDSINTSFSAAKSIVSLLVGIAIDEGYINSVEDSIGSYIEEFKDTEFEDITIEDLLKMNSNIKYKEGNLWFGDDAKTYYMPNLRNLALNKIEIDDNYNGEFLYNNYHPLLLGIIIERSTGFPVSVYMENKIWKKLGAEFDASWSLDSQKSGFEKMESGINVRAIDFAKIGSMVLNQGKWNNEQIVSQQWIKLSTTPELSTSDDEYRDYWLKNNDIDYNFMWYSTRNDETKEDIFALGKYGQYIYISPKNKIVIVRHGKEYGRINNWIEVFKEITKLSESMEDG